MTTDPSHHGHLRPYQTEGVRFLARSDTALLADEMGLGKTVQTAVALMFDKAALQRVLLIAPASLCLNWQRELEKWAPDLAVRRVIGDAEDRAATYHLPIRVLIASYEQIRSDVYRFNADISFDLTILDEAQRIKNTSSDTSLACRLIPRKRAWALSGTPLENRPADIISIFRFLKPGLLRQGMSRMEIHERIADHFLRRTKKSVLSELPPIIVQDIPLELGRSQRYTYDDTWGSRLDAVRDQNGNVSSANMLAVITRLKQICNFDPETGDSAKFDALRLVLEAVSESNEKVLIFSQYVETLESISKRIDLPHNLFHGGLSQDRRDAVISEFRERPGPQALLMSLKAGGVGLNLQEASTVVLFDRWWNPATENQAIQRAHRFGRTSPLQVIRFLVVDSIEERIDEIFDEKEELFEEYVERATSAQIPTPLERDLKRILQV